VRSAELREEHPHEKGHRKGCVGSVLERDIDGAREIVSDLANAIDRILPSGADRRSSLAESVLRLVKRRCDVAVVVLARGRLIFLMISSMLIVGPILIVGSVLVFRAGWTRFDPLIVLLSLSLPLELARYC